MISESESTTLKSTEKTAVMQLMFLGQGGGKTTKN